jgi:hypothetical protein
MLKVLIPGLGSSSQLFELRLGLFELMLGLFEPMHNIICKKDVH